VTPTEGLRYVVCSVVVVVVRVGGDLSSTVSQLDRHRRAQRTAAPMIRMDFISLDASGYLEEWVVVVVESIDVVDWL
jgi:hypothetical protein